MSDKNKVRLNKVLQHEIVRRFPKVVFAVSYEFIRISSISDIDARLRDHCHT